MKMYRLNQPTRHVYARNALRSLRISFWSIIFTLDLLFLLLIFFKNGKYLVELLYFLT